MQYTKISPRVQRELDQLIRDNPPLKDIVAAIHNVGGVTLLVGGAVRDCILGRKVKDLDLEVHNLPFTELERILATFGSVNAVGKTYGVLRLHTLDADWSVPRSDATGRKPQVVLNPYMGYKKAFARRDLTINALGIDLTSYTLIDPFGGLNDLQAGILSPPDSQRFVEDPLRFYRVMQFVGRFGMQPTPELNTLCAGMDLSGVSHERIEQECFKWLLKSEKPSLSLDWLHSIGRLKTVFPEVYALIGVPQSPQWHPEGDVYEHTKQALDAAAALEYVDEQERLMIMLAVLCHDLGKAVSTEEVDGTYKSIGHEKTGVPLAKRLVKRITRQKDLIEAVAKAVRYHMAPPQFVDQGAKLSAYKRLAGKIAPHLSLQQLAKVALADRRGRNPQKGSPLVGPIAEIDAFVKKARKAGVFNEVEQPVLQGRDLLDVISPGPALGRLLKKAYQIQLNEGIRDKERLKRRVLAFKEE